MRDSPLQGPEGGILTVQVVGLFAMEGPHGEDLLPKGLKARGLLALLIFAPEGRRSRRWIEGKLWSDRGPEQASASLRQALSELRKALGDLSEVISSDRQTISLTQGAAVVDLFEMRARNEPLPESREILEGLEIRDPGFEAWLRDLRREYASEPAANATAPALPRRMTLLNLPDAGTNRFERMLSGAVLDQISQNLMEALDAHLISGAGETISDLPPHSLRMRSSVVREKGVAHVALRLEDPVRRGPVWSRRMSLSADELDLFANDDLLQVADEAMGAVIEAMPRLATGGEGAFCADLLLARALIEMFSFDPSRLRTADELLAAAENALRRPIHRAWRSLLRMFMVVERTEADLEALRAEAEAFALEALQADSSNSLVLAVVSVVKLLLGEDVAEGYALARHALARNSGSAIGYVALSIALMRMRKIEPALSAAQRARRISARSGSLHWIEMFCCLSAILAGQIEQAILSAESALSRAPKFRPPMRHLYALYLMKGDAEKASQVAERLRVYEPDFSMRLIREDETYPAGTIRGTRLIHLRDV